MAGEVKHTPGPFVVRQPDAWPFDIEVVGPDGELAWSERRYAHSTVQKNLADCMFAMGFNHDERPAIIESLNRQVADIRLRATAPDLLEALHKIMNNWDDLHPKDRAQARAAIAKAEGQS